MDIFGARLQELRDTYRFTFHGCRVSDRELSIIAELLRRNTESISLQYFPNGATRTLMTTGNQPMSPQGSIYLCSEPPNSPKFKGFPNEITNARLESTIANIFTQPYMAAVFQGQIMIKDVIEMARTNPVGFPLLNGQTAGASNAHPLSELLAYADQAK